MKVVKYREIKWKLITLDTEISKTSNHRSVFPPWTQRANWAKSKEVGQIENRNPIKKKQSFSLFQLISLKPEWWRWEDTGYKLPLIEMEWEHHYRAYQHYKGIRYIYVINRRMPAGSTLQMKFTDCFKIYKRPNSSRIT